MSDGVAPLDAVEPAFGLTPTALQTELRAYRSGSMPYATYPTPPSDDVAISVQTLPPSADALFPLSIRLNYAQRGDDGPQVLAQVRATGWPA